MNYHAQIGNLSISVLWYLRNVKNYTEVIWNFRTFEIARRARQNGEMEESASHHLQERISYALVRGKTLNII